ncbi:thiol:disulfide interchange protein DsbG [Aidingimonas halophila]|uniref:Thiol:disulfide interchange protein n=1 Tax=Aidingimonas halophila TaxID=574349 RepID=A0A1H2RZR5_9GAMM|nr:thiol:disulfide interchange protein DsbG [Aidingimonas halophila]GHC18498.1 thiol:disulfide interchange protein DsbG [Aidingimonas halophila]SDW24670.1 Thiol:disulfide interchange protein DsbC [Aidingimonas halophila]
MRIPAPFVPLLLAMSSLPMSVMAQEWPAPIRALEEQNLTIHESFDAPAGMTGYAASVQDREIAIYLTEDGEHAIVGNMVDAEGNNLSEAPLQEIVRGPQEERIRQDLQDSAWIADGRDDADRVIYMFSDTHCPYCQEFWEDSRDWVEAGNVQIRHILVGILDRESPRQAMTILEADDPAAMLDRHHRGEPIEWLETIRPEMEDQVYGNQQLMESLGLVATPGLIYHVDGQLEMTQGIPEDMENVMGSPRP